MNDQKNLLVALVLCFLILFGFQYFFSPSGPGPSEDTAPLKTQEQAASSPLPSSPSQLLPRGEALKTTARRLPLHNKSVHGSLNLQGALFDDLTLTQYRKTVSPTSPEITLLSPPNASDAYYVQFSWAPLQNVALPDEYAVWTTEDKALTEQTPVTLSWDNGQGVLFQQIISIDEHYMFTVTQKVTNRGQTPLSLTPQSLLTRRGDPQSSGFFILHEGPVGVFEGKLSDPSYEDVAKTGKLNNPQGKGWLGLTDKYWLTALIPDPETSMTSSYTHQGAGPMTRITAMYQRPALSLAPGETLEITDHFFAGAKVLNLLDGYETTLGIKHFDLAVDFGWFYFLTKPIFYALEFLKGILGNFGLAILTLTVFMKLLFLPLANKSYESMAKMKALQPEIEKIRERYADDRMKMNEKVMEFYRAEKLNPLAGCLPMLIQIPVFFALYKVLFVTIEMRQAPFYGWIHDLSAPDPTTIFNLFGLLAWTPPSYLMIGAWPLLMGVTMFLQQKLSPPPTDPAQAKMFLLMPFFFTYLLAQFPAGLVIYWTWNNILSIGQQWVIMKRAAWKREKKRGPQKS